MSTISSYMSLSAKAFGPIAYEPFERGFKSAFSHPAADCIAATTESFTAVNALNAAVSAPADSFAHFATSLLKNPTDPSAI